MPNDRFLSRRARSLVMAAAFASGGCERAEFTIQHASQAVGDRAQAVFNRRKERRLQEAFTRLRAAAASAPTATLYLVANEFDGDYQAVKSHAARTVDRYPVRKEISLPAQRIGALVNHLTTRSTYFPPDDGWTCMFEPRHVLEVDSGDSAMMVVICIHCGDVAFIADGDEIAGASVLREGNAKLTAILQELSGTEVSRP